MKRWVIGALGLAVALASSSACDSTATISVKSIKVETLQVVSATPVVQGADSAAASCQVAPDDEIVGFDVALTVKGTSLRDMLSCAGDVDRDQAIRPGDRVERVRVLPGDNLTPESFELEVECVEELPDPDDGPCEGLSSPSVDLDGLSWVANHEVGADPVRCEPIALAILVDQSGSVAGLVNPDLGFQEDVQGEFVWPDDTIRQQRATDPDNQRLATVEAILSRMNANDKLVVFSYQERNAATNLQVLCTGEPAPATGNLAEAPEYFRKAINCFGTNRAAIEEAVAFAYGEEEGRTPLWSSVKAAYEFLQDDRVRAPKNRHIVVIGDGPDTCNVSSDEFLTGKPQCSADSYEDVRQLVLESNQLPGASPVHIHFVQMQAWGYRDRDPRQQELACLTGGHHIFIDGFDMERSSGTPELAMALREAVSRIRYSFAGNWHLRVSTPAFQVGEGDAGYLAPGFLYGMSGNLSLLSGTFSNTDKSQPFNATGYSLTGVWDQRLAFRRMCDDDAQCAGIRVVEDDNPCVQTTAMCSDQARVCGGGGEALADGTACTTNAITAGECLEGICRRPCTSDDDCGCTQDCDNREKVCLPLGGTGSRVEGEACLDESGNAGVCDAEANCVGAS